MGFKLENELISEGDIRTPNSTASDPCWIDQLPDELISPILVAAAPQSRDPSENQFSQYDRVRFPVLMQYVCRRWKAITLSTPALWAILDIDSSSSSTFLLYLQRSGIMPLEVYLDNPYAASVTRSESVVLTIQNHTSRIRRLHLNEVGSALTRNTFAESSDLSNLLELSVLEDGHGRQTPAGWLYIKAPQLRSLRAINYSLDWTAFPATKNLQRLCVMESRSAPLPLMLLVEVLRSNPGLRVLELENQLIEYDDSKPLESHPVILDQLEVLSLKRFFRRELGIMFGQIHGPHLKKLRVQGLSSEESSSERSLVLHFPEVEILEAERLDMDIAKHLPTIKHLIFTCYLPVKLRAGIDREFQSLCTHWRSLGKPIPLETLQMDGASISTLLSFLESSKPNLVPALRELSVNTLDAYPGEDSTEEEFQSRAEAKKRLGEMVRLNVWGVMDDPYLGYVFKTWRDRMLWVTESGGI